MKARVIKNYYSENGGVNNVTVFQVWKSFYILKSFRGKTAEYRANRFAEKINSQHS